MNGRLRTERETLKEGYWAITSKMYSHLQIKRWRISNKVEAASVIRYLSILNVHLATLVIANTGLAFKLMMAKTESILSGSLLDWLVWELIFGDRQRIRYDYLSCASFPLCVLVQLLWVSFWPKNQASRNLIVWEFMKKSCKSIEKPWISRTLLSHTLWICLSVSTN